MKNYWIIPRLNPSQIVDGKNLFLFKSFFYEVEYDDPENVLEEILDFADPAGLSLEEDVKLGRGIVYLIQTDMYAWDNMLSKLEARLPREEDGMSYIFKNQKFVVENTDGFYMLQFDELWANYAVLSPSIVKVNLSYADKTATWIHD